MTIDFTGLMQKVERGHRLRYYHLVRIGATNIFLSNQPFRLLFALCVHRKRKRVVDGWISGKELSEMIGESRLSACANRLRQKMLDDYLSQKKDVPDPVIEASNKWGWRVITEPKRIKFNRDALAESLDADLLKMLEDL